jgi:ATP-dependent DNA ligase
VSSIPFRLMRVSEVGFANDPQGKLARHCRNSLCSPKSARSIPVRRRDLFESAEWVYELKHDGFRALAYLDGEQCRLLSRRGNEIKRFNDLSERSQGAERKERHLDGEIVALK